MPFFSSCGETGIVFGMGLDFRCSFSLPAARQASFSGYDWISDAFFLFLRRDWHRFRHGTGFPMPFFSSCGETGIDFGMGLDFRCLFFSSFDETGIDFGMGLDFRCSFSLPAARLTSISGQILTSDALLSLPSRALTSILRLIYNPDATRTSGLEISCFLLKLYKD